MSIRAEVRSLRPRASKRARALRVQDRVVRIVTAALGAALAWWVAGDVLDHPQPFFAPVTVIVTLGLTYGQRLRRVAELVVGVAVGVLVGDLFVYLFGTGVWQIAVVASLAMTIATFLGAGPLLTVQAGVQAIIVTTLVAAPDQALSRWLDAVVGGVVALGLAAFAPPAPVRRPRRDVIHVVDEIAEILRECAEVLRQRDAVGADRVLRRARATEELLATVRDSSRAALEVAAISPFHLRHRPELRVLADAVTPLDRCIRNLRVVARRVVVAVRNDEPVPDRYVELLTHLADVVTALSEALGTEAPPEELQAPLVAIAHETTVRVDEPSLSAELLRGQVSSMTVDLLMVTGLTYAQALRAIRTEPADDDGPPPGR